MQLERRLYEFFPQFLVFTTKHVKINPTLQINVPASSSELDIIIIYYSYY
jgi:hypothetical protein